MSQTKISQAKLTCRQTLNSTVATCIVFATAIFFAQPSQAAEKSFCFAMAESYYEQLYCEIQSKGEGKNLPAFYQFKNNTEQTQALLLKRSALKIGVVVKAPTLRSATKQASYALELKQPPSKPLKSTSHQAPQSTNPASRDSKPALGAQDTSCSLQDKAINCGQRRFQLLTNLHNKHLTKTALEPTNQMALPRFSGDMNNDNQVRNYLYAAYEQYLNKMHSIGLAGVTTRFGKFSYLFYDYHDKGLDFPNRFETLFHYLKKDKAALAVSEQAANNVGMSLEQCAWLSEKYYICEYGNSNLVYAAE